jgi:hypothetical protein
MSRLSACLQRWFVRNWPVACGLTAALSLAAGCAQDPAELKIGITSPSDGDTVHLGSEISFASSVKGGEKPIKLSWKFDSKNDGDVSPATSSGKNPDTIVFSTPGTYKVVLSATDDKLQDASDSIEIEASYDALELSITSPGGDQSIGVGESLDFTAEVVSGEEPVEVEWNFDSKGVGGASVESSTDLEPGEVTFSQPGKYVVTLSATDDAGQTSETKATITVSYEQFVSHFTATRGDEQITLEWTLPSDPDYQNIVIRRSTSAAPTEPDDPGDDPIAGELDPPDTTTSHVDGAGTDNPLENGTKYYYSIFAYKTGPIYGTAVSASATPKDVTPPAAPTAVVVTAGAGSATITWTDPADADFVDVDNPGHIEVRRSKTSYPQTPTDGQPADCGDVAPTIQSCADSGLDDDTRYFYTVFAFDEPEADNHSVPTVGSTGNDKTDP